MLNRIFVLCLLLANLSLGAIIEYDPFGYALDGYLTNGEYAEDIILTENSVLTVSGNGGAYSIEAKDYSKLIVESTSTPASSSFDKGVWSILLTNSSTLNFSGGATNIIAMKKNATALLTGGQINNISSYQVVNDNPHITIVCQKDYRLAYENNIPKILYGNWLDGTPFEINFININGLEPVFDNVKIIPEPASMLLLGLGGIFLKRRR